MISDFPFRVHSNFGDPSTAFIEFSHCSLTSIDYFLSHILFGKTIAAEFQLGLHAITPAIARHCTFMVYHRALCLSHLLNFRNLAVHVYIEGANSRWVSTGKR